MADLELGPVMARYSRALDAKPSKGEITADGIAAITDSVCDVPRLLAEIERLTNWKASALTVMDGLQELGQALGLPLGERITGPLARAAAEALNTRAEAAEAAIDRVREMAYELLQPSYLFPNGQVRMSDRLLAVLSGPEPSPGSPSSPELAPEDTTAPAEPTERRVEGESIIGPGPAEVDRG